MKCQSTALGKELDTEKLNHAAVGMATLKEMRNTENAAFAGKSEDLWIGDFNTVRNSCKREVMGYVTIGKPLVYKIIKGQFYTQLAEKKFLNNFYNIVESF